MPDDGDDCREVPVRFGCLREHYAYLKVVDMSAVLQDGEKLLLRGDVLTPGGVIQVNVDEEKGQVLFFFTPRAKGNITLYTRVPVTRLDTEGGEQTGKIRFALHASVLNKTMGKPMLRSDVKELARSDGLESEADTGW